jgi:hypothetical protein
MRRIKGLVDKRMFAPSKPITKAKTNDSTLTCTVTQAPPKSRGIYAQTSSNLSINTLYSLYSLIRSIAVQTICHATQTTFIST